MYKTPPPSNNVPKLPPTLSPLPSQTLRPEYWYSPPTVAALCAAAQELAGPHGRIAFLSTPSLYFALPASARAGHAVLDLDQQWAADPGFVRYDYREGAAGLPAAARGAFAVAVIDPPFITEGVWRLYAEAAAALLAPGGCVLCTTVAENGALLASLFPGTVLLPFQPSIPHLVYQYNTFCSAPAPPLALAARNPEIPE